MGTLLYELCAQTNICQVPCDSYGLIVTRYRANLRKPIRPLNADHYTEPCQRLVDNLLQVRLGARIKLKCSYQSVG